MKGLRWTKEQYTEYVKRGLTPPEVVRTPKPNKFKAQKTDGFASKHEAECHRSLTLRGAAGEIADLQTQVTLRIEISGVLICKYIADFTWTEAGAFKVGDAKGYRTPVYRLKKKLVKAVLGIDIIEL